MAKKQTGVIPKSRAEIDALLADGTALDIADIAKQHSQDAVDLLASAMDRDVEPDDRPPWSVSTKAAKALIEIGYGRSAVKEAPKEEGGITVVINELTVNQALSRTISASQIRRGLENATAIDLESVEGGAKD